MKVQFDSIMENATIQKYSSFLPLELAIKYYQKWECDVSCQVEDSIYYKCLQGNGTVHFLNGNSYTGAFHNGFMHGNGTYRWKNGLIYEGLMKHNTISGEGKLRWPNGSFYTGAVFQGKRHGYGEYYCAVDRSNYKGSWNQGVKDGKGVLNFANGSIYEGDFKAGLRQGIGKMKYPSGNEYEGQWKADKKEGRGVMNWHTTLEKYEGQWKDDLPAGLGTYFWFQGKADNKSIKTIFKGEWKQGKREGFGAFYYNNGCRLEGTFVNNLKEGLCYLVDEFGDGHIETFKGDKSVLKKQEIALKEQKKHFKLPQISQYKKVDAVNSIVQPSVLQVNEPQQNNYWKFIDFECGLIDESIFNLLLRENSQLRQWYRTMVNNLNREIFNGLNIEGLWRLVKDMRLTDETITIASLNRHFFKGHKARFEVDFASKAKLTLLKAHTNLLTPHNYPRIEWQLFFEQARGLKADWSDWKWIFGEKAVQLEKIGLGKELNIHSSEHIILFRHFVTYLLHLTLLQQKHTPNTSFRKCLQDLFCSIKVAFSPVSNFKTEKNCSEILTNVSHNQSKLHIPEDYSDINRVLFGELSRGRPQLLGVVDHTVTVRQLYCLLTHCSLLREPAEKILFLQKIERNMNVKGSLLRKDNKGAYQALQRILLKSAHFSHVLNYELVETEFDQILYVFLNRKIGNTQSKEDFLKRYREIVKTISASFLVHTQKPTRDVPSFNFSRSSTKDKQKQAFLQRLAEERERQAEEERKIREVKREERERILMKREDFDVKDEELSEASEEYYD